MSITPKYQVGKNVYIRRNNGVLEICFEEGSKFKCHPVIEVGDTFIMNTPYYEQTKTTMKQQLKELIKECKEISSNWNGDESGYAEEQANIANDITEKATELIDLINELNGTNE